MSRVRRRKSDGEYVGLNQRGLRRSPRQPWDLLPEPLIRVALRSWGVLPAPVRHALGQLGYVINPGQSTRSDSRRGSSADSPQFRLRVAEEREHLLSALVQGSEEAATVLEVTSEVEHLDEARAALRDRFALDDLQANAVLDMQFRRTTRRERARLREELEGLRTEIADIRRER